MTETEIKNTQKAMAYDLIRIFERDADKSYTTDELKKILDAYITGSQQ